MTTGLLPTRSWSAPASVPTGGGSRRHDIHSGPGPSFRSRTVGKSLGEGSFPSRDSCHRRQRYGERIIIVAAAKVQSSAGTPTRQPKTRLPTIVRSAKAPVIMNHAKVGRSGRRGALARASRLPLIFPALSRCETRLLTLVNIRPTRCVCPPIKNALGDRLLQPDQRRTTTSHRRAYSGGPSTGLKGESPSLALPGSQTTVGGRAGRTGRLLGSMITRSTGWSSLSGRTTDHDDVTAAGDEPNWRTDLFNDSQQMWLPGGYRRVARSPHATPLALAGFAPLLAATTSASAGMRVQSAPSGRCWPRLRRPT